MHTNARGISRGKHYRYALQTGLSPESLEALAARVSWRARGPERRGEVPPSTDEEVARWHIHPTPDLDAMRQAAAHLLGTHDFAALRSARCTATDTMRTLHHIDIAQHGDHLTVDIHGDAFLRQMIRVMIGTLLEVGVGLRRADSMPGLLASRNRRIAGFTAPSRGLTLVRIVIDPVEPA